MNLVSKDISHDFPSSNKIYLNNASVSLMPSQSIDAMKDFLISYNSLGPDSKDSELFVAEKLSNVRKIIAKIMSLGEREINSRDIGEEVMLMDFHLIINLIL